MATLTTSTGRAYPVEVLHEAGGAVEVRVTLAPGIVAGARSPIGDERDATEVARESAEKIEALAKVAGIPLVTA